MDLSKFAKFANFTDGMMNLSFGKVCSEKSLEILKDNKLETLNLLGQQKETWQNILSIVLLFSTIISGVMGYGKSTKDSKKKPLSETTKTICKIIFWISLFCLIPMSGFSLFKYYIYSREYFKWLKKLGKYPSCQNKIIMKNIMRQTLNSLG